VAYRPDLDVAVRQGIWRRFGDRVLKRPGLALGGTLALFGFLSLGLLAYEEDYSIGGFFRKHVESVDGFDVLGRSFPQGALGPTSILVQRAGAPATDADLAGVDASLPTFAFIFLVALGVDYTNLLMSRVREEARTYGTREGVLRGCPPRGR
jgi:uncharacterized membrane protein YdfJ with MMPL/SSD domain